MDWHGELPGNLHRIEVKILAAAEKAVALGGEHVLGESTKIVPLEEGTLSRSGKTSAEMTGDVAVAAVSYDTPYAARQHEEMDWRHDPGRQAKYLEQPLGAAAPTVAKIYAQAAREALQ